MVSPTILKELKFKLGDKFPLAKEFFDKSSYIKIIKTSEEDYSFARDLESELKYEISFFDCLHIAMSKRLNLKLITKDKELLKIANNCHFFII
jgi:predicted nucleic acid-binding protein